MLLFAVPFISWLLGISQSLPSYYNCKVRNYYNCHSTNGGETKGLYFKATWVPKDADRHLLVFQLLPSLADLVANSSLGQQCLIAVLSIKSSGISLPMSF